MKAHERISARVRGIKISATKLMPMIAAERGGCVSLGQGVPSFATPEHVIEAVAKSLRDEPAAGKYSLQPGMPALRRAVADQLLAEKGLAADPDAEIMISVGAMEALLAAVLTVIDKGDECLVPEPFYPSHVEQIYLAEGRPVFFPLRRDDWGLDADAARAAVTDRTRAIIVNSPHNPTGSVFAKEDLLKIAELAIEKDLIVICDDTYDALSYDGKKAFSLSQLPELRDRLIAVNSFSKRYAMTGWRAGYAFAPKPLMDELLKVHDCSAICAPTPSQYAALASLTGPQDVYLDFVKRLESRRELACARLDAMAPKIRYVRPNGAFYIIAHYDAPGLSSAEAAIRLIKEAGVITIPGEAFGPGARQGLRLSFGGAEEALSEAFDRMEGWFAAL